MMDREKLKGHLFILAANILFAVSMSISEYLLPEHVQSEALTNMRMSFVCAMFRITSLFVPYEEVSLKGLGLLYLCAPRGVGLSQRLFIWGLNTMLPVDASTIATVVPISVMVLAALVLKEPVTRMKTFGVLPGMCGAISLILRPTQGSNQVSSLGGNLLTMASGFTYSVYLVVPEPLTLKYSSVTMMKRMLLFSTLITLLLAIESIWSTPVFHKEVFDGQELGTISLVLFGATFVPYLLIPLVSKRIRPTTVSMYSYIQLIVASFIVVCIGQDSSSVTKLAPVALIFSGVYLVTQSKSRTDLEQRNSQSFDKNTCNMKNNA